MHNFPHTKGNQFRNFTITTRVVQISARANISRTYQTGARRRLSNHAHGTSVPEHQSSFDRCRSHRSLCCHWPNQTRTNNRINIFSNYHPTTIAKQLGTIRGSRCCWCATPRLENVATCAVATGASAVDHSLQKHFYGDRLVGTSLEL